MLHLHLCCTSVFLYVSRIYSNGLLGSQCWWTLVLLATCMYIVWYRLYVFMLANKLSSCASRYLCESAEYNQTSCPQTVLWGFCACATLISWHWHLTCDISMMGLQVLRTWYFSETTFINTELHNAWIIIRLEFWPQTVLSPSGNR